MMRHFTSSPVADVNLSSRRSIWNERNRSIFLKEITLIVYSLSLKIMTKYYIYLDAFFIDKTYLDKFESLQMERE